MGCSIPMKPLFSRGTMNRFASRSGVLLLVVGLGFITELPSHSQSGGADEKTFILLQHDWAEARKKSDMVFLENFYASEFTVGNMNGSESSRAEDLAMFSSGDMKPAVITDGELKVTRGSWFGMIFVRRPKIVRTFDSRSVDASPPLLESNTTASPPRASMLCSRRPGIRLRQGTSDRH